MEVEAEPARPRPRLRRGQRRHQDEPQLRRARRHPHLHLAHPRTGQAQGRQLAAGQRGLLALPRPRGRHRARHRWHPGRGCTARSSCAAAGDLLPDQQFTIVFNDMTINNLTAGPDFQATVGERVEIIMITHGEYYHTFHVHGHRWADNRTGLLEGPDDPSRVIDTKITGPGRLLRLPDRRRRRRRGRRVDVPLPCPEPLGHGDGRAPPDRRTLMGRFPAMMVMAGTHGSRSWPD